LVCNVILYNALNKSAEKIKALSCLVVVCIISVISMIFIDWMDESGYVQDSLLIKRISFLIFVPLYIHAFFKSNDAIYKNKS